MAKRACIFPSWVESLDAGIAEEGRIQGRCAKCGEVRRVDLAALRDVKGGAYSLKNRRTRCKLTAGCDGWVRFHYMHGVMRPLWDDATADRWLSQEACHDARMER